MWSADLDGAEAVVRDPLVGTIIDDIADEWFEVQHRQLAGLLLSARGDFDEAQAALSGCPSRLLALGDVSAVMFAWYLRAFVARVSGDLDGVGEYLALARELGWSGVNRVTQAMVMNELAHLARARGAASAPAELAAAIDELKRVGRLRMAAEQRAELGMWLLTDGGVDDGIDEVARALPVLLRTHRGMAAVMLGELASVLTASGDDAFAGKLARAAADCLANYGGPGPTVERRARVGALALALGAEATAPVTDDELLDLVSGLRRR